MKKFFFLPFFFLVFTSSVFSKSSNEFDPFYVGIAGGYWDQSFKDHYTQQNIIPIGTQGPTYSNTDFHEQNIKSFSLLGGYGFNPFGLIFAAIEGNFNWYSSGKNFTPSEPFYTYSNFSQASLSQEYGMQVALLPGILVTPKTLAYGRIGYGYELYKNSYVTDIPVVFPKRFSNSPWISEYILGIGINQKLLKQISLRLEFQYVDVNNIPGVRGSTFGVPGPGPEIRLFNNHQDNYDLHSRVGLLSVIYYPEIFN
ncbi:hypothetical protein EP47_08880 [Legionella norrlandica]|uniref:Outer membrane protein beta-barrel domain-containing protein n=1 Tax=Legionella norrlandica TaxID=1498499 RepID=A0A0A2T575_9GAMM|nr:outer membrane beta-barrel protein [Legionella norrlandica]KGP62588.1 hypothetical protein EP47_08880 [Legionella norrlandica]